MHLCSECQNQRTESIHCGFGHSTTHYCNAERSRKVNLVTGEIKRKLCDEVRKYMQNSGYKNDCEYFEQKQPKLAPLVRFIRMLAGNIEGSR